ncbi:MAG: hypothetical protein OXI57_04120 [Rhodospirillales bacterium]|nr:hypothetical protein [Rhodospirillales bacterium]
MPDTSRRIVQRRLLALAALAIAILFFLYDLVVDIVIDDELGTTHVIIELIVFLGVTMALLLGARDLGRLRTRLDQEEKRNRAVSQGLADSIAELMDEWRMTSSEKDVAWLIIKGYRFAEIAEARGVKENTTRLQATAIYSKAGVSGRAEFVAEIIQSLLLLLPDHKRASQ